MRRQTGQLPTFVVPALIGSATSAELIVTVQLPTFGVPAPFIIAAFWKTRNICCSAIRV
jgi:hypothetical protein